MSKKNGENLDNEFNKIVGKVLKKIRTDKKMSLENVCKNMNYKIKKQQLNSYENNQYRLTNKLFQEICIALNEEPNVIFEKIHQEFNRNMNNYFSSNVIQDNSIIFNPLDFGKLIKQKANKLGINRNKLAKKINSATNSNISDNEIQLIYNGKYILSFEEYSIIKSSLQLTDDEIPNYLVNQYINSNNVKLSDNKKERLDVVSNLSDKEWELVSKYIELIKQK